MNSQKKSIVSCVEGARRAWPAALAVALALAGCASGDKPATGEAAGSGVGALFGGRKASNWEDYKRAAALKMMAANPKAMHDGVVEQPALAIPVIKVVLNADGSVRRAEVVRRPSQARDTEQLALNAVRSSGPYGSVEHLPKPWEFTEAFLFNNDRRFKPSVLDR
jgi:hypothetical protein